MTTTVTSCDEVILKNLLTEIASYDSKLKAAYNKIQSLRNWQRAVFNRTNSLKSGYDLINKKYESGFYILKYYPVNISEEAFNQAGILNTKIEKTILPNGEIFEYANAEFFWNRNIVNMHTGEKMQCPGQTSGVCCYSISGIDTACCACGKYYGCNSGGGCANTCNELTPNYNCQAKLQNNLFKTTIDKEKENYEKSVDDQIKNLQNIYDSIILPTETDLMQIGCCQNMIFQDIQSSYGITFDGNTQKCMLGNTPIQ